MIEKIENFTTKNRKNFVPDSTNNWSIEAMK